MKLFFTYYKVRYKLSNIEVSMPQSCLVTDNIMKNSILDFKESGGRKTSGHAFKTENKRLVIKRFYNFGGMPWTSLEAITDKILGSL